MDKIRYLPCMTAEVPIVILAAAGVICADFIVGCCLFIMFNILFAPTLLWNFKLCKQNNDLAFLVSNPDSIAGIPLNLINKQNKFNFMIIKKTKDNQKKDNSNNDYSQDFNIGSIKDIESDTEFINQIKFNKKFLLMKLDYSISNVRTLLINTEYSIINCLPCNLTIHFSHKKVFNFLHKI